MSTEVIIIIASVAALILILIASNIRIVPQSKAWVMERIGVYSRTWHTGLHIKIPFIERAAKKVDLREQILVCGEAVPYNHGQYHNHRNGLVTTNREQSLSGVAYGSTDNIIDSKIKGRDRAKISETLSDVADRAQGKGSSSETAILKDIRNIGGLVDGRFTSNFALQADAHNRRVHSPKSQPVITKDNVSMEIDTVVFYNVTDPKLYAYGHATPLKAIEHIVATSLRNIVGEMELDETLTSRDLINTKMRTILDEATDPWGIRVTRVELRNIIISDVELAEAMEKQMIAEREKRAKVIAAEAERKSAILVAEGEKQAKILAAEADKQEKILQAEGKAEAIRLVNEALPSQEFLTIRALEAYEVASHGQATKIIVPSNLQSLAGLALTGSEVFKEGEKMEAPKVDVVE